MTDDFDSRVRQVVMDVLGDPLGLPTAFRSWVPRWVEPQLELSRSQVLGAYTTGVSVAGLGERVHGRPCMLRVGSSPYEFTQLTYDETYGKWVSDQVWFVSAASLTTNPANWTVDWTGAIMIPNFKALYEAGLRPLVFSAALISMVGTGEVSLRAEIHEVADGDSDATRIATGGEISRADTENNQYITTGTWQAMTVSPAPSDPHAYLTFGLKTDGGANGGRLHCTLAFRWEAP